MATHSVAQNEEPRQMDPTNPVVALCAQGMAVDGTPTEALRLFEQAWAARRDDFDAAIAAHFMARHQSTAAATLHWNVLAVQHAEAVSDGRCDELLASLYLNLGDAHARLGQRELARAAVQRAAESLDGLPSGGYRDFVAMGIDRLMHRVEAARGVDPATSRLPEAPCIHPPCE
jgi:tetratricopeptide (TPR) repeat protein